MLLGSLGTVSSSHIETEPETDCGCGNSKGDSEGDNNQDIGSTFYPITLLNDLPSSYDLRDEIDMPAIEDQGSRGTCWALAPIGALECTIKKNTGTTVDLSEQWLISCTDAGDADGGSYTDHGGGYMLIKYGCCSIGYNACFLNCSGVDLNAELVVKKGSTVLADGAIIRPTDSITFVGKVTGGVSRYIYKLDPEGDGDYQYGNSDKTYNTEYYIKTNYQYEPGVHGEITAKLNVKDYLYFNADLSDNKDSDNDQFTLIVNQKPNKPSGGREFGGYWAKATDPDGDNIKYLFDWNGDDSVDYETDYKSSGTQVSVEHKKSDNVHVKVKDQYGEESDWSSPLGKSRPVINPLLSHFFEKFPVFREFIFSFFISVC